MSNNVFGKTDLVYKIGKKINNSIRSRLLDDIVDLITNFICDEISVNKNLSVNKFGTFYQVSTKSRLVWSNFKQKEIFSRPKRKVMFAPHMTFSKLLKNKRKAIIEAFKTQKEHSDKKKC
jgi:nucleoid DNA-binding protein